MRTYLVPAGALFSAVVLLAQQPGSNIVPDESLNKAVQRAVEHAMTPGFPAPPPLRNSPGKPQIFRFKPAPISTVCAIPLLEAKTKPTHDHIATSSQGPAIDPKMAVAPRIPACPTTVVAPKRP